MSMKAMKRLAVAAAACAGLVCGRSASTEPAESAQCVSSVALVSRGTTVWMGNEPHPNSALIASVCLLGNAKLEPKAIELFDSWVRGQQGHGEGTGERFCEVGRIGKPPSPLVLREAQKQLPQVTDWCWVLGSQSVS